MGTTTTPQSATTSSAIVISDSPVVLLQLETWQVVAGLITFIFVAGISWGKLWHAAQRIQRTLDEKIEPDLKDVRERFVVVEEKVNVLWKDKFAPAYSPRQLNDRGSAILQESGIREIIDEKRDALLDSISEQLPTNAYDAEKMILSVVADIPKKYPDVLPRLKDGAFRAGADIETVLFVGGVYLRNGIFLELGFTIDDIDHHAE